MKNMKPWMRASIFGAIAFLVAGGLTVLTILVLVPRVFVPAGKYNRAESMQKEGDLAEAYDAFDRAGDFRDAMDRKIMLQEQAIASRSSDTMEFGGKEWLVLEERDGRALLLTKDVLEMRPYHEALVDITWENCNLRAYLNGAFYRSFNDAERARIVQTNVVNSDNVDNDANVAAGGDTRDHVFLLSISQAKFYFPKPADRAARLSGGGAAYWWLRSPGLEPFLAAAVGSDGNIGFTGSGVDWTNRGVRPAMWVTVE